jgi:hypothetical protein
MLNAKAWNMGRSFGNRLSCACDEPDFNEEAYVMALFADDVA